MVQASRTRNISVAHVQVVVNNMNKKKAIAKKMKKYDLVGAIMAYEDDSLDEKGTKKLFAHLNKTGLTGKLQGHYGRENERRNKLGLN